ncbi:MAG: hypothetical protein P1U40_00615 [Coxiellaceae bacterium]|nr:hypothetical protein [Coxiellaceae bacterium]
MNDRDFLTILACCGATVAFVFCCARALQKCYDVDDDNGPVIIHNNPVQPIPADVGLFAQPAGGPPSTRQPAPPALQLTVRNPAGGLMLTTARNGDDFRQVIAAQRPRDLKTGTGSITDAANEEPTSSRTP